MDTIQVTVDAMKNVLGDSNDIVYKQTFVHGNKNLPLTIIFIDGLTNVDKVSDFILKPININNILKNVFTEKAAIVRILDGAAYFPTTKA